MRLITNLLSQVKKKEVMITDEMRAEFKEAFQLFDTDKSGSIDASELAFCMRALGFEPTGQEVADMLSKTDEDQDGSVSYEEFEDLMSGRMVTTPPQDGPVEAWYHCRT